jgi:hypothetical protein
VSLIADLTQLSNKKTIKISKRHEWAFPKRNKQMATDDWQDS